MITNSEWTVVKKWPRPYIQRDNGQQMAKINKVVTKYNDNGDVSSLLLLTSCNKFCMRKMDFHKNNNVYFILNVQDKTFLQKCCDNDCCRFISPRFVF